MVVTRYFILLSGFFVLPSDSLRYLEAEYGIDVTLESNYRSASYYTWYKSTTAIYPGSWKYKGTQTYSLTIIDINFDDASNYKVQYYVNGGWTTEHFNLSVTGRPVFLTQDGLQYVVATGKSQTLSCSLHPKINPKIQSTCWSKSTKYITADNNKYVIDNHQQSSSLTINNVNHQDNGTYICNAENLKGQAFIEAILLVGDAPAVNIPENQYYAIRNKHITVECTISGANTITWYKNSYLIWLPSSRYKGGTLFQPNLTIERVQYYDDGTYTCTATNDFGSNSASTEVLSGDRPEIAFNQNTYNIERSATVVLTCRVRNSLVVKWFKLDAHRTPNPILETQRHKIKTTPDQSLIITNVYSGDEGIYRCTASNRYGTSQADTNLTVGDRPNIRALQNDVSASIGSRVILNVTVNSDLPLIDVYWSKRNINLTGTRYIRSNFQTHSLTVNRVVETDDGQFTCTAVNNFGRASTTITLFTWKSPIVNLSGNNFVPIKSNTEIRCIIDSKPHARRITWKLRRRGIEELIDLDDISKYTSYNDLQRSILTIKNVQIDDSNFYICEAENSHGVGRDEMKIKVGDLTQANIPVERYVGRKGEDITMQCLFSGNASYLTWTKTQRKVTTNINLHSSKYSGGTTTNPNLVVTNLDEHDTCKYTCQIDNLFGTSNASVFLKVISASIPGRYPRTLTANDTLELHCNVFGSPNLLWKKNGAIIEPSTRSVKNLKIANLTRIHSGNYTCETTLDNVTATSSAAHVLVRDNPFVYTLIDSLQGETGVNLDLSCNHDTYPESIQMYWMKDGDKIDAPNLDGKYNFSNIKTPHLVIQDTELSDTGAYRCCVQNEIGTSCSTDINIIIKDPEQTSLAGLVTGSIVGVVLAVVCFVILLWILKRRRNTKRPSRRSPDVRFIPVSNVGGVYANLNIQNDKEDDFVDEGAPTTLMKPATIEEDTSYYNISDIITTIKVSDLRSYIEQHQNRDTLQNQYKSIPYGVQYPTTKGEMIENKSKNRYKSTLPYDHTRVVLESSSSDYINANYIDGFEKEGCYIASQGPIKHTIDDHWKMIWQHNTRKIVMLTNLKEAGKVKCYRYWPIGGQTLKCGDIVLTLLSEKERAAYITREIDVENIKTKEKREVTQYHFTAWPDHGTPDPLYLVLFHKHVISDKKNENVGPVVVHCSAGIGRTGTYIGLDALYEEGTITHCVDVVKYVKKMRHSRMNMIQTQEQYKCLHLALLEMFRIKDTKLLKAEFENVWRDIKADKRPVNHQGLNEEFKMLQEKMAQHHPFQYSGAKREDNINKNRNQNVLASDNTRLFLTTFEKGRTDYINAVQIPSYTKFVGYLSTQLPLQDTMVDFWTMITDHNSSTIVLLLMDAKEAEMVYAPEGLKCGSFSIKITRPRSEENGVEVVSAQISRKGEKARPLEIFQCMFKDRPDPASLCTIVNLISTRIEMSSDPVTVVSSDGARNCGLFCTFVNAVSSMTIDENADIFQLARLLKLRRPEFFDDFEEYRSCYEAVNLYLESSNVYANY